MPLKLIAKDKGELQIVSYSLPSLNDYGIRVKSLFSGISHQTEMAILEETTPSFHKTWDKERRFYSANFGSKKYPASLGYECVGEVVAIGGKVKGVRKGDFLWADQPHSEEFVLDSRDSSYYLLPSEKNLEKYAFLAMTRVAIGGIHDAKPLIGENCLITGLGTLGLISCQLAKLSGASKILSSDPSKLKRGIAKKLGAIPFDSKNSDLPSRIHSLISPGVDFSIETSGQIEALKDCLSSSKIGGKIVTLGTYRNTGKASLPFAEEWHRNRLSLISSMTVNGCPHRDYPLWDLHRLNLLAKELLSKNILKTKPMISHRIRFKDSLKAYKMIRENPDKTVKVILKYD